MDRVNLSGEQWMEHPAIAQTTHERMSHEGILLASLDLDGKLNPMTIGWGIFGWIWGRPIFTSLVRPSRYTYACIEATGDYTVNVQPADRKDLADFCGTVSGREHDKMAVLNLSALPSRHITSPGITECPIVFECKVVHKNDILPPELPADIKAQYYPVDDFHRVYYGQIMNVSIERKFLAKLEEEAG